MSIAQRLMEESKTIGGVLQWPYRAVGIAFEVIPRTLAENCGSDVIRVMTELRAKHANGQNPTLGIDGETGAIVDMNDPERGVWDPYAVKIQTYKTAIEAACMLLRVDEIVSGISGGSR